MATPGCEDVETARECEVFKRTECTILKFFTCLDIFSLWSSGERLAIAMNFNNQSLPLASHFTRSLLLPIIIMTIKMNSAFYDLLPPHSVINMMRCSWAHHACCPREFCHCSVNKLGRFGTSLRPSYFHQRPLNTQTWERFIQNQKSDHLNPGVGPDLATWF